MDGQRGHRGPNATGLAGALSISPASYKLKVPVFFVNGTNNLLSAQRSALQSSGMKNFLITGDGKVMSSSVESFLSRLDGVRCLSGSDRYAISLAIARYAVSSLGMS